jgi:deoxyadenosine/deoxycytidine kinase
MKLIFIEGNIGAGKTSLLKALGEHFGEKVRIVEEPVKVWEESGLLAECYDGTVSRATFQYVALATKTAALAEALRETPPEKLIIAERSPFSDAAVFAKAFLEEEVEQRAYGVAHDAAMRTLGPLDCGFLFLEGASTATLTERIRKRNRNGEASIDAGLLAQLETLHAELKQTLQASGRTVLGLDCDKDSDGIFQDAVEFIKPHARPLGVP